MQGARHGPNTCVLSSTIISGDKSDKPPCPLCSNALVQQKDLIENLQRIEQRYLTKVESEAVTRMQYEYYVHNYMRPLADNNRPYVKVTLDDIREHFSEHMVSHKRLILSDISSAREVQMTLMESIDYGERSDQTIKTWMQLSKHKHELVRALAGLSDGSRDLPNVQVALNAV